MHLSPENLNSSMERRFYRVKTSRTGTRHHIISMFKKYDPFCKSEMAELGLTSGKMLTKVINNNYNYSKHFLI